MFYFVGLHHPSDAKKAKRCMISAARLRNRSEDFYPNTWMIDSGGFEELWNRTEYRDSVEQYGDRLIRWARCGELAAAISQDYPCPPSLLKKRESTVEEHQELTIERYTALFAYLKQINPDIYVMPVLQGWEPSEYVSHLKKYGKLLRFGAWVCVGSLVPKSTDAIAIEKILSAIKNERADLRLHGLGLGLAAIKGGLNKSLLWSADSQKWSLTARKEGRDANDYREALTYAAKCEAIEISPQSSLLDPLYKEWCQTFNDVA